MSKRTARRRAARRPAAGVRRPDPMLAAAREALASGEHERAALIFGELGRRAPDDVDAVRGLGQALAAGGRDAEAVAPLRAALVLSPDDPELLAALADVLAREGDAAGALAQARRLASALPQRTDALSRLGHAALNAGALDEAARAFRDVFELAPHAPGACLDFARSRRFTAGDEALVARMQATLQDRSLSAEGRADICFALAKALEDLGRFDAAFAALRRANETMRAVLAFDAAAHVASVDAIIDTFDAATFAASSGRGVADPLPVFVVGMPRSGTTLVEQILAAHPAVHGAGELPWLDRLSRTAARRLGMRYPRCASRIDEPLAAELGGRYLAAVRARSGAALRATDKLPANFLHLGLAGLIVPGARVVHCRRSALDTCVSVFAQQFAQGHEWAYDLDDIALFHEQYERLMEHWREVLPLPMMELEYESVVDDLAGSSRRLIEFIGLDWDDACVSFHRSGRPVGTASNWQVRQPLYRGSVGRWRRYRKELDGLARRLGVSAVLEDGGRRPPTPATGTAHEPAVALGPGPHRQGA